MSMDEPEVVVDYIHGLPDQSGDQDQEAYHIDLDALAPNTDELDFGLDETFKDPTDDAVDLSAVDVDHPLEEIGYEEEAEDEETMNDADPAASTSIIRDENDGNEGDLDEIGYEDDDGFPFESTAEHVQESLDKEIVELDAAQDGAALVPEEVDDGAVEDIDALQEIEVQARDLGEHAVTEEHDFVINDTVEVYDDEQLAQELEEDEQELAENDLDADSMEHDGSNANDDGEEADDDDNNNHDIGNSESHQPSDLPDVAVEYNHVRYSLFGGPEDHDDDYFLKDLSVLDKPLSYLFSCLRDVIMDDLSQSDELLIRIDNLNGLEFREHSTSSILNRKLREILDLYYRLLANDGLPEDRLLIHLVVTPDSEDVLARLLAAAEDGQGFSELAGSSGGVSPAVDQDNQRSYHRDDDALQEETEVGTLEYAEEYSVNEESVVGPETEVIGDETSHTGAVHDGIHSLGEYATENYADIDGNGADQFENFDTNASDPHLSENLDGKAQDTDNQDGDTARDIRTDHEEIDGGVGDADFAAVDLSNPDAAADVMQHDPLVDPFDAENESGAAAQDLSADGLEFSLDVGGGADLMINAHQDPLEYALQSDDEHDGAHQANATADSGEPEYQVDVGSPRYEINVEGESVAANQLDDSFDKVTQDEATHRTADQRVSSAQTSATSTLNGEEISYDENEAFEQSLTTNPAILDMELGTTVDEIDWDNAEIGEEDDEAKSVNLTPRSTSGKRLRQVEDFESLVDEGDNKRRRT